MRVALLDERSAALVQEDVKPGAARLEPGEEVEFSVVFQNPPAAVLNVSIVFIDRF
jgi:uncharacterized cupredoxin-like copper-binding protein